LRAGSGEGFRPCPEHRRAVSDRGEDGRDSDLALSGPEACGGPGWAESALMAIALLTFSTFRIYRQLGEKILEGLFLAEVLHSYSGLFFRQEKGFQDLL
jgi:hypothetical protein